MAKDDWGDDELSGGDVSYADGEKLKSSLAVTKYQTSRHLCVNTGLSIGTVVDWLDGNGTDVYGEQVGNIWVYYLKDNMPSRLPKPKKMYFGGADGRQIILRDDPQRGNTGPLKIGQTVVLDLPKPPPDERKTYSQNLPKFDLEELTRLAEINPDLDEIADELEVNANRLRYDLNMSPALQRAYAKGRKIYMENNKKETLTEVENKAAGTPETAARAAANGAGKALPLSKRLTEAVVEDAALRGLTTSQLAAEVGVGGKYPGKQVESIIYSSKHPELKRAWKTGKARRTADAVMSPVGLPEGDGFDERLTSEAASELTSEVSSEVSSEAFCKAEAVETDFLPLETTAENFTQLPDADLEAETDRREKIEEVQNKLMPRATIFNDVEYIGRLMPRRAAGLQIGFEGDFFSLTEKQRRLMFEMAHLNDEFQKED